MSLQAEVGNLFAPTRRAVWSKDGIYRYRLEDVWNEDDPKINFCLLNPSVAGKADPKKPGKLRSDPTYTRAIERAKNWHEFATAKPYRVGGVIFTNAYAYSETDRTKLFDAADPVGPENDAFIVQAAQDARKSGGLVICAWGATCQPARSRAVLKLLMHKAQVTPHALRFTKGGAPEHILYLPYDLRPIPIISPNYCRGCGCEIAADSLACGECMCEDDCSPW